MTTTGGGAATVVDRLGLRGVELSAPIMDLTMAGNNATYAAALEKCLQSDCDAVLAAVGSSAQFHPEVAVEPIVRAQGAEADRGFLHAAGRAFARARRGRRHRGVSHARGLRRCAGCVLRLARAATARGGRARYRCIAGVRALQPARRAGGGLGHRRSAGLPAFDSLPRGGEAAGSAQDRPRRRAARYQGSPGFAEKGRRAATQNACWCREWSPGWPRRSSAIATTRWSGRSWWWARAACWPRSTAMPWCAWRR